LGLLLLLYSKAIEPLVAYEQLGVQELLHTETIYGASLKEKIGFHSTNW
jgi:hypothetical protein